MDILFGIGQGLIGVAKLIASCAMIWIAACGLPLALLMIPTSISPIFRPREDGGYAESPGYTIVWTYTLLLAAATYAVATSSWKTMLVGDGFFQFDTILRVFVALLTSAADFIFGGIVHLPRQYAEIVSWDISKNNLNGLVLFAFALLPLLGASLLGKKTIRRFIGLLSAIFLGWAFSYWIVQVYLPLLALAAIAVGLALFAAMVSANAEKTIRPGDSIRVRRE